MGLFSSILIFYSEPSHVSVQNLNLCLDCTNTKEFIIRHTAELVGGLYFHGNLSRMDCGVTISQLCVD